MGHCRALGMTRYHLIGIQVGRVAWQEVQRELAPCAGNVVFDQRLFVRRQSIDHQSYGFFALVYQFLEQLDKQLPR